MTRTEAKLLAAFAGRAFFVGSQDEKCVMLNKDGSPKGTIGPVLRSVSDLRSLRSHLNAVYVAGCKGSLAGKFYANKTEVRFCKENNFPSESDEEYMARLFSHREALGCAEALNKVLSLAISEAV